MPTPEYSNRLTRGNASMAKRWVSDSHLTNSAKDLLVEFIDNFPSMMFTKDEPLLLDHYETRHHITLPPWFREVRCVLEIVDSMTQVRFDGFDFDTPAADEVDDSWFYLGLIPMGDAQRSFFLSRAGVCPIGEEESGLSFLGINIDDFENRYIYEFHGEDLLDNVADGRAAYSSIYPAFSSYSSMLSHITEIQLSDDIVIEARSGTR